VRSDLASTGSHSLIGLPSDTKPSPRVNDSPEQFRTFRLSMPGLAQSGGRLEPAENLFHPFAFDLTDGESGMASGATVDGAVNRTNSFGRYPCRHPA
jgi:hypothetical protein